MTDADTYNTIKGLLLTAPDLVPASDLAALRAENERLREALGNLRDRAQSPVNLYERNGPQWTDRGREFYDADYFIETAREIVEMAAAALEATP